MAWQAVASVQELTGALAFGAKGLRPTSDNSLSNITVTTSAHEVAIRNDTTVAGFGTLTLHNVTTTGQVYLVCRAPSRCGTARATRQ